MNNLLRSIVLLITLLSQPHTFSEALTFVFSEGGPPITSYSNGYPVGLFPEMVKLVFSMIPEYDIKLEGYPWARAQEFETERQKLIDRNRQVAIDRMTVQRGMQKSHANPLLSNSKLCKQLYLSWRFPNKAKSEVYEAISKQLYCPPTHSFKI